MNKFITLAFPTDQHLALNILYLCLMINSEKSFVIIFWSRNSSKFSVCFLCVGSKIKIFLQRLLM